MFCTKYQILEAEINFALQIVIAIKPDTGRECGGWCVINSFYAEISSERFILSQLQYLKRIIIKSVALKLIVKYKFLCRCKSLLFCSEIYFILTVENLGTVKL